jgi:hypothetical protein
MKTSIWLIGFFFSISAAAQTWQGEFRGTGVSAYGNLCEVQMKIEDISSNLQRLTFPQLVCHEEGFDLILSKMLETDFSISGTDMIVPSKDGPTVCGKIDEVQMSCERKSIGSFLSVQKANATDFDFNILIGSGITVKGTLHPL